MTIDYTPAFLTGRLAIVVGTISGAGVLGLLYAIKEISACLS